MLIKKHAIFLLLILLLPRPAIADSDQDNDDTTINLNSDVADATLTFPDMITCPSGAQARDWTQCPADDVSKLKQAQGGSNKPDLSNVDINNAQVVMTDSGRAIYDKDGKPIFVVDMTDEQKAQLGISDDPNFVKVANKYDNPDYCSLNPRTQKECADYQKQKQQQSQKQSVRQTAKSGPVLSSCEYAKRYRQDLVDSMCTELPTSDANSSASINSNSDQAACRISGKIVYMSKDQCNDLGGN